MPAIRGRRHAGKAAKDARGSRPPRCALPYDAAGDPAGHGRVKAGV